MATLSITPGEIDSGLLYPNFYWPAGTTITYSIPNGGTIWASNYGSSEPTTSYSEFNATQATQFAAALEIWDSYIANSLVQVDDGATYGDIRGAFTNIADPNVAGLAYSPPFQGNAFSAREGDIWIDTSKTGSNFATGTQDFQLLLHEAGHALGLKHPFESPTLPSQYDNHAYTVMSYTAADQRLTFSGGGGSISWSRAPTADKTPMVLDIAAIQSRYGLDTQTGAGTTTYIFTDADVDARQAIYDASGNDTFDLSALSRGSTLDLRPGAYSDVDYFSKAAQIAATKAQFPGFDAFIDSAYNQPGVTVYEWARNVGIAFSTVIENAIGSDQSDIVTGNSVANRIDGRGGADKIYGLGGSDDLYGSGGDDVLRGGNGADTMTGGSGADNMDGQDGWDTYFVDSLDYVRDTGTSGTDTVVASSSFTLKTGNGIENIRLTTGGTGNLTGNELGNAITAYGGANVLMGLGGNDTIRAGTGNDTIRGGLGSDKLYGEAGADTFVFKTGESLAATGVNGADVIMDFTTGSDHIDLAIFGGTPATSAYAEVKVNSDSFAVLKSAAEAAMTGSQRVVFVGGTSHGWLFWSSNGPDGTVEEAVQLSGRANLSLFDRADII